MKKLLFWVGVAFAAAIGSMVLQGVLAPTFQDRLVGMAEKAIASDRALCLSAISGVSEWDHIWILPTGTRLSRVPELARKDWPLRDLDRLSDELEDDNAQILVFLEGDTVAAFHGVDQDLLGLPVMENEPQATAAITVRRAGNRLDATAIDGKCGDPEPANQDASSG